MEATSRPTEAGEEPEKGASRPVCQRWRRVAAGGRARAGGGARLPDPAVGKAIPYGVYDLGANAGWVSVGSDHDTAAFAVASLRRWWETMGKALYPTADRLLVTADAGGSNGYRVRAWKTELARFAAETGLQVTVCHFPPGTSKWNKSA